MSPADWESCGEGGGGAYGGDYRPGTHRGRGRHPLNSAREAQGRVQQPLAAPGDQKPPAVRWVPPGDDRPPK